MRRVLLVVLLCPAVAIADIHLDTAPIPDLFPLEAAFHLDRGQGWGRSTGGVIGSIGAGYGRFDDENTGTLAGALAAGTHTKHWLVLASTELVTANDSIWRGRHTGLAQLHSEEDRADGLGGSVALQTTIDHGDARALAPVHLGQGRRRSGDVGGEALLHLGKDKDDFVFVAQLFGEVGTTHWSSDLLDHADRRSLGLGVGMSPADGELPRGSIDLLRGRVEHVTIARPVIAAGSAAVGEANIRIAEIGLGAHEMTLHIDRELLAVIEGDLGWSWIEADTSAGPIDDNLFRMKLATSLAWRTDRARGVRRLGIGVAREPGYTPDGQRLVVDWRTTLTYGVETPVYSLRASGGLSWISTLAGAWAPTLPRYGTSVELFFKLWRGIEAGAYVATSFENQRAGDPWATDRAWSTESGLLLRFRHDPKLRAPAPRYVCGGVHSSH